MARQLRAGPSAAHRVHLDLPARPGARARDLKPLARLFDSSAQTDTQSNAQRVDQLPPELERLYGGQLAFYGPCVYANFVSSIDGIVAIEDGKAPSGGIISGRNEADRFVMGLLRAFADAILVGAGTVRAEGGRALWTPQFIYPAAADAYRELREKLRRALDPLLVIVSARGDLDPSDRALQHGALVLTTKASETRLRASLPAASRVLAIAEGARLDPDQVMRALHAEGHRVILTEGGPGLFGQLVQAGLVDELFLTISPTLAGQKNNQSFGLIHGIDFGKDLKWATLSSARQHDSHLFLRYRLKDAA